MSSITSADLSRYYDFMHLWTRFNKGFRSFSGVEANTIHRWLTDPDSGEFSPTTIHKIMRSLGISDGAPVDALDAGCGYGGTMFALHAALGGRWHGVTISSRQFAVGRNLARQQSLAGAVTFTRGSYDELQARTYNLIYGIESLIHSTDPARTIGNLARALRPGGTFIIVDDMPAERSPEPWTSHLERFKALWRCPIMPSVQQWSAHLNAGGCDVIEVRDLSALMRPRSAPEIAQAIEEVGARRRWRDPLGCEASGRPRPAGCCSKICSARASSPTR